MNNEEIKMSKIKTNLEYVSSLFRAFLGRDPDEDAAQQFVTYLNNKKDLRVIVDVLRDSDEYKLHLVNDPRELNINLKYLIQIMSKQLSDTEKQNKLANDIIYQNFESKLLFQLTDILYETGF